MAQMGCYVPAQAAVIPVRDSILSRIGTGDDMENNMSTFLMEMQEMTQVGFPFQSNAETKGMYEWGFRHVPTSGEMLRLPRGIIGA